MTHPAISGSRPGNREAAIRESMIRRHSTAQSVIMGPAFAGTAQLRWRGRGLDRLDQASIRDAAAGASQA